MKLLKKVIKIGGSKGIIFDKILIDSYNIEEGDLADISDITFVKKKKEVKK